MAGAGIGGGSTLGTTVEVSEIESLTDGHIIVGDGSGAPTTRAAYTSSTGAVLAPVGAAATPGYAFTGLATTGIYTGDGLIRMTFGGTLGLHFGDSIIYFGATADVAAARNAAGVLEVNNGTAGTFRDLRARALLQSGENGQAATIEQLTEAHTLTAGATSLTTIQIPAGAMALGVSVRVTTEITGCTTFDLGVTGAATRYGTGLALTAGTTNATCSTATAPTIYQSAIGLLFTAVGGGASFTAGAARVTVTFVRMTAPTS